MKGMACNRLSACGSASRNLFARCRSPPFFFLSSSQVITKSLFTTSSFAQSANLSFPSSLLAPCHSPLYHVTESTEDRRSPLSSVSTLCQTSPWSCQSPLGHFNLPPAYLCPPTHCTPNHSPPPNRTLIHTNTHTHSLSLPPLFLVCS